MAGIHFALTIPNAAFTEYCFMDHPINIYLFQNKKLSINNGYVKKPMCFGLGVKFDKNLMKKFPYKEKINTMISTSNNEIKLTV